MITRTSDPYSTGRYTSTKVRVDYEYGRFTVTVLYSRTNWYSQTSQASNWVIRLNNASGAIVASGSAPYVSFSGGPTTDGYVWSGTINSVPTYPNALYLSFTSTGNTHFLDYVGAIPVPYPAKPTVVVTAISDTEVQLDYGTSSFNDASGSVGLRYSTTPGGPYTLIDSATTTGTHTFNHTGLTPGTTYYYKANAANTVLISWSDEVSITPVTPVDVGLPKIYGSVNDLTEKVDKLYGSVNGNTKKILKVYGSVNGQTKRIF